MKKLCIAPESSSWCNHRWS